MVRPARSAATGLGGRPSHARSTRVLVVDDQAPARAGLRAILSAQPGVDVVGEACDAVEALQHVENLRPSIVLVDLYMPSVDGLSFTETLKGQPNAPSVVLISVDPSPSALLAGLRAGADATVLKGSPGAQFQRAIREALEGGPVLDPELAAYLIELERSGPGGEAMMFAQPLTEVESEVVRLTAAGCTRWEIARKLDLRSDDVPTHVRRILSKLAGR